jgi:hypothetical protein
MSLIGYIWPEFSDHPSKCPDGTSPGMADIHGIYTRCVLCENPELSKDGVCNNVRKMEASLEIREEDHVSQSPIRMGTSASFVADTSYTWYFSKEKIKEDCYTCAALCLGIAPDQIETYNFTLPQLLEPKPSNTATECSKCALYCADLSGCASLCVPLEFQILAILAAFLSFVLPFLLCFCIFFRPRRVQVEKSHYEGFIRCPFNPEHMVPEGSNYCPQCGVRIDAIDPVPDFVNKDE